MGSYKFYGWVSWSCFICVITERLRVTVSVITTWQIGMGDSPHLTAAHSARPGICEVPLHSKAYHPYSCQTSRIDLLVLFLYPATEVGNYRRGCLLKLDMSAGDNANCCSGKLSIGPHALGIFLGPSLIEADCVIQEKHINDTLVVRYFRASPVGRHVCFRQHTCFDPAPRCTFDAVSNHLACCLSKMFSFSMNVIVVSIY